VLLLVGLLMFSSAAAANRGATIAPGPSVAASSPAPSTAPAPNGGTPAGGTTPSASTPCSSLNATICISMLNTTGPDIIPPPGSHVTSTEPPSADTISLYIKSEYSLVWPTAKSAGAFSPLSLNATGVLWNGDPFYNAADGSTWHPSGSTWWTPGPTGTNTTYPYWYGLNFSAKGPTGLANFFPGMTLTWWVYFVTNTSGVYSHWSSVPFQFTFAGAWPYSPDPGAAQYAGAGAASADLDVSQNPLAPNFNDTVNITIATTSADLLPQATIGGAYLELTELAPDGAVLDQSTMSFPVTVTGTLGAVQSPVTLPASLAQNPGALVQYTITAWDTNFYGPDQIETQTYNYTVNGNGSFASGVFVDDLALTTAPVGPGLHGTPPPVVAAGQPVRLLLTSRSPSTAIYAAEVAYTFNYAAINESVAGTIGFARYNSTNFGATLPPMPLGAAIQFQVLAWDFAQNRDVSSEYSYVTPTLASILPSIPTNSTFFLVYVYDNGTHQWVTGANVQVDSVSGYVHTYATSFDGVSYPNATGDAFVPLLLPAGEGYQITVQDPSFVPANGGVAGVMEASLTAPHVLTQQGVLKVGPDYVVAQSGDAVYFWLNESGPGATYSPPVASDGVAMLAAVIGLIALALAVVPLLAWWSRIRARRDAQEKRITL
jgi:hypothetical protein